MGAEQSRSVCGDVQPTTSSNRTSRARDPQLCAGSLLPHFTSNASLQRDQLAAWPAADDGPSCPPIEVLQCLRRCLPVQDVLSARMVCKEWAQELAGHVVTVHLPAQLWRCPCGDQQGQHMVQLLANFPSFQKACFSCDASTSSSSSSSSSSTISSSMDNSVSRMAQCPVAGAMQALAGSKAPLKCIELQGVSQPQDWAPIFSALAASLSCRLQALELTDACMPAAEDLGALKQLTLLTQLQLGVPHCDRLRAAHVAVLRSIRQLRQLNLSFRAVEGSMFAPLALDALADLSLLTSLELSYTGLPELAASVGFVAHGSLTRLARLQSLTINHIPLGSLQPLASLAALHSLALRQHWALSSTQCSLLAKCTQLRSLLLDSMAWDGIGCLASLTQLTALALRLDGASLADSSHSFGSARLLVQALCKLRSLGSLTLEGAVRLAPGHVQALAHSLPALKHLSLCCSLTHGTHGFARFSVLRSLRLQQFHWGQRQGGYWAGRNPKLLLRLQDLPPSLRILETVDVVYISASNGDGSRNGIGGSSSRDPCGYSSDSSGGSVGEADAGLALDDAAAAWARSPWDVLTQRSDDVHVPVQSQQLLATRSAPLPSCHLQELDAQRNEQKDQLPVRCVPALVHLKLRWSSTGAPMQCLPDLGLLTSLQSLQLCHEALCDSHIHSIAAQLPGLAALQLAATGPEDCLSRDGLAALSVLSQLSQLQLSVHDGALLGRRTRAALARLTHLRVLSLHTSSALPGACGKALAAAVTKLSGLQRLQVGLGLGCMQAAAGMCDDVAAALPRCRVKPLAEGVEAFGYGARQRGSSVQLLHAACFARD